MTAHTDVAPAKGRAPEVWLRVGEFDRLTRAKGWYTDLAVAQVLGVSHTTVGRLRNIEDPSQPSGRFIAAALDKLNVPFDAIFERRA
jgi:transcriptional regulator with XRE-family HTH domain